MGAPNSQCKDENLATFHPAMRKLEERGETMLHGLGVGLDSKSPFGAGDTPPGVRRHCFADRRLASVSARVT